MKKKFLSMFILFSMLLGMVSSVGASTFTASTVMQQSNPPTTNVVARVFFTSQDDLNALASRYDILSVNQEYGFALMLLTPQVFSSLQEAGYMIVIDEAKTKLLSQPMLPLPGQGPESIPGFPCYRTVEETYDSLQDIVISHPQLAQVFDIGDSWDMVTPGGPAGYDILALRLTNENFGNLDEKPTFFLMAEIHAREYTTAEIAMRYAEHLVNNYGTNPDITWLLDYFRVYIVTMTNPDGRKIAETGDWWRKNVDNDDGCTSPSSWGTDLNRNHSFKWLGNGSSPYPCDETYRGPSAGSEPETQAIQNFVASIFPDQRGPGDADPAPDDATGVFITLHSFSQVVLYPWGWTSSPAPNMADMRTLGRRFGYFNNYEVCQSNSGCMYATNGTSDDWAYGTLGIASYTFELGTEFFESCGSFESFTYPNNVPALLYAFKAARRPYQSPAGPDSLNVSATPAAANPGELVLLTAVANDTRYNGGEPTQPIAEARFSIDSPSWITGTVTYPMTASDGSFNSTIENIQATIDTSSLSSGRHTIFVESKDTGNNWGVPTATFLYIVEPGVSPVIQGYVREAATNLPIDATVRAGELFLTTTDPATGFYSMTVISDTYDMRVDADNFAPGYAGDVIAHNYQTVDQDFLLYPYCSVFSDDVESGNIGWTVQSPWAITTESSHSPTHSWTDSPGGNYGNYRDVSITSPSFDFTGLTGVELSFWHKYNTEAGYDYANVEYSVDNGATWSLATAYDGYNTTWHQENVPLAGLDGLPDAKVRFHFTSDSYITGDGWHIDDISINAGGPSCISLFPPDADFSSDSPVELGQAIQFTNLTTGTLPIEYAWDFGDGTGTSTETNPSYTYLSLGTYTVTLDAANPYGTDSAIHVVSVEATAVSGVELTQVSPSLAFPGDLVTLNTDVSPDTATMPYTYTINYGDGIEYTGTSSLDPLLLEHAFASSGRYTVQVWVWNTGMNQPVTDTLEVVVGYKNYLALTLK